MSRIRINKIKYEKVFYRETKKNVKKEKVSNGHCASKPAARPDNRKLLERDMSS